jgi:competence protein ComEA
LTPFNPRRYSSPKHPLLEVYSPLTDQLERYRWLIVAVFAVPLLSGIAYLVSNRLDNPQPLQIDTSSSVPSDIRVYVTGAVQQPGVYPLQDGDRWIDALEAAGGAAPDADLNAVNLSRRAQDEDHVYVPPQGRSSAVAGASQSPLVNINTADEAQLESLPGIGEVRARSIVQSRTSDGPFASIDDLLARNVITQSVFDDIAPLITVTQ